MTRLESLLRSEHLCKAKDCKVSCYKLWKPVRIHGGLIGSFSQKKKKKKQKNNFTTISWMSFAEHVKMKNN